MKSLHLFSKAQVYLRLSGVSAPCQHHRETLVPQKAASRKEARSFSIIVPAVRQLQKRPSLMFLGWGRRPQLLVRRGAMNHA